MLRLNHQRSEIKRKWDEICTNIDSSDSDLSELHQIGKDLSSFNTKLIAETEELKEIVSHSDIFDLTEVESVSSEILQEWDGYKSGLDSYKVRINEKINFILHAKLDDLKQQLSGNDVSLKDLAHLNISDQMKTIQVRFSL